MEILEVSNIPFHTIKYRSSGRGGTVREVTLPFFSLNVSWLPSGISFVVTSDLQGREVNNNNRLVGEAVAEELTLLVECGDIAKPDFILLAGDLYDHHDMRKLGGTGDVTAVFNALSKVSSVVGVLGNHDIVEMLFLDDNVTILDGSTTNISGLKIAGVSGIVGAAERNQRKTEEEFKKYLDKSFSNDVDVLVMHQCPDAPDIGESGEPSIREYLTLKGSSLVFVGHRHWKIPHTRIGGNQVINVANRVYVVRAMSDNGISSHE